MLSIHTENKIYVICWRRS